MDPDRTAAKTRSQPKEASDRPSSSSDDDWGTYFLGPYRVVDEIGVGGMATVELARMDGAGGFQKWVAIKRIHPHLTEDPQFINMFLDEARIAASISHPNVAQVFDLGKYENTYWIAMEYLHGEPLREIMRVNEERYRALQPEIAARVIADAAEGLHAAHELRGKDGRPLNLVHRDVTPHNLFITYDGVVKVVDFGIAKVTDSLSSTHAGTIKGKIAYMSPEQVRGQPIDRRTDVFALGVVLWEMTTGRRLFRVDSDLATLSRVEACVVPPPSALNEDYPPELETVVLKALQKEPSARYQTAREFSRALQRYLMGSKLFVGPEEVSAYVKELFSDRVRKRDDHLRWAAEVTQTISIRKALTQEACGDLLDLSKLPREGETGSVDSDSMEFDTIRDQQAPNVDGVPSPLGQTGSSTRPELADRRQDPLARTVGATPSARDQAGRRGGYSETEAVVVEDGRRAGAAAFDAEEDDEDEMATLVASSPNVVNSVLATLGKARMGSPVDDAPDPDTLSKTNAMPRGDVDVQVSLDDVEGGDALGAARPTAPWASEETARPTETGEPMWQQQHARPGPPVFDVHSNPAAKTMQLKAVRPSISPLVVFAAALGAGFVAAGLGAIWWVRSARPHAPPTVSAPVAVTASDKVTRSEYVAPPRPPATMRALPVDQDAGGEAPAEEEEKPAPSAKPSPPSTAAAGNDEREETKDSILEAIPDLPLDPSETDEIRPGFLSVHCRPDCDTITAGGNTFGGSVSRASMPPGQYKVQCTRGDVTKVISVIVVSDQHTSQGVSMR